MNTSSLDIKTLRSVLSDSHSETPGVLKREEEILVPDTTVFPQTLDTMNPLRLDNTQKPHIKKEEAGETPLGHKIKKQKLLNRQKKPQNEN